MTDCPWAGRISGPSDDRQVDGQAATKALAFPASDKTAVMFIKMELAFRSLFEFIPSDSSSAHLERGSPPPTNHRNQAPVSHKKRRKKENKKKEIGSLGPVMVSNILALPYTCAFRPFDPGHQRKQCPVRYRREFCSYRK